LLTEALAAISATFFTYPVVPPKVEYALTERGQRAIPVIETIRAYGLELMAEMGVSHDG